MANKVVRLPVVSGLGQTLRKDNWWLGPLVTFLVIVGFFIVYAPFRVMENNYYAWGPYLSPLASPWVDVRPFGIAILSPAMLILPFPGLFRLTCYYYRKAYYRSFAMSPPGCAVGAARPGKYNGERKLLLFQNLHRYALYFALLFLVFLWHDFYESLWWAQSWGVGANGLPAPQGAVRFGMGVGSVVIMLNCLFLSLYTFSCHSFRHLVGGNLNSYSEAPLGMLRHRLWKWVSGLNINHMAFAWISLFGVGLCDFYLRQVASGAITDYRLF